MTVTIPAAVDPDWPIFRLGARSWALYLLALGDGSAEAIREAAATYRDAYGASARMTGIWHAARAEYLRAVADAAARHRTLTDLEGTNS